MLTQEILQNTLFYNGTNFIRKHSGNGWNAGDIAGSLNSVHGYRYLHVCGKKYLEHRLVWLYVYGSFPDCQIDHINRVRSDNRIENLRLAHKNESDNLQNSSIRTDNKSGYIGVSFHQSRKKWQAFIQYNKKMKWLGYFETAELASCAYIKAKQIYHPFATQAAK